MLNGARVFVVVPALNEEAHVGRVLDTMPAFVDHIVVVDDGSTDETASIVRRASDPRVVLLRHDMRRGVGAAIATGYERTLAMEGTECDALCVMAGDGQMDPTDHHDVAE